MIGGRKSDMFSTVRFRSNSAFDTSCKFMENTLLIFPARRPQMPNSKLGSHIDEIKRLYFSEGISLRAIGERFGVSRQAVHQVLGKEEGPLRGRRPQTSHIDTAAIKRMYVEHDFTAAEISERTGLSPWQVKIALKRENVPSRRHGPRYRTLTGYDHLQIGGSIMEPRPTRKGKWHGKFYERAKAAGIRVSVQTIDENTVRVTRVE